MVIFRLKTYQILRYRRLSSIEVLYTTPCRAPEVRIAFVSISRHGICASGNVLRASRQRRLKGLSRVAEADLFYLSPLLSVARGGQKTIGHAAGLFTVLSVRNRPEPTAHVHPRK